MQRLVEKHGGHRVRGERRAFRQVCEFYRISGFRVETKFGTPSAESADIRRIFCVTSRLTRGGEPRYVSTRILRSRRNRWRGTRIGESGYKIAAPR